MQDTIESGHCPLGKLLLSETGIDTVCFQMFSSRPTLIAERTNHVELKMLESKNSIKLTSGKNHGFFLELWLIMIVVTQNFLLFHWLMKVAEMRV